MSKYDKDLCRHVHIISSQHLSLDATLIQCQDHHSSGRKQGGFSSQVMTQERVHRGATSESVYIYVTSIYIIYMECRHWCRNHLGWEQTPMQEPPPCGNHPPGGTHRHIYIPIFYDSQCVAVHPLYAFGKAHSRRPLIRTTVSGGCWLGSSSILW